MSTNIDPNIKIIAIGIGGAGRHVLSTLTAVLEDQGLPASIIAGALDDNPSQENYLRLVNTFPGVKYLGGLKDWLAGSPEPHQFVVGINSGAVRQKIDTMLSEAGHIPLTLVHPRASVGVGVELGKGSIVSDQVALDTNVRLGRSVHVSQGAVVGHDSILADFSSINPRACISGNVVVGQRTLIGASASVIQGIKVGAGATVGMGAAVIRPVEEGQTVVGVPAAPLERGASSRKDERPLTIGLLTSVGMMLDAFFVEIVKRWEDQGVRVVTAAGTKAHKFPDQTVIEGLGFSPDLSSARSLASLRKWVKDNDVDVVITNAATGSVLVRTAGVDAPVIYFCHSLHWNGNGPKTVPYRIIEKGLLPRTAGIACINNDDERWFAKHAARKPRLRLRAGVGLDTERYTRGEWEPPREGQRAEIVWCGRFMGGKNPHAALDVARELKRRGIDFRLTMLGEGEMWKEIKDAAADLGDLVEMPGQVDTVPYFRRAHVLLQTSRREGLPRVALEAVAMGLPTVGFDVKGVRDIPGVRLATEGDVAALTARVIEAFREGPVSLPEHETLSFVHTADALLEFTRNVVSGSFPDGKVVTR